MANVFISHSTIDKGLADYLCNAFEERGLSCWIAPRDIVPGAEWAVSITNAIAEADVLFVLYSKNSVKSTQVTKEIGIADRKGKYILPYKIDDTEPEGAFDYYLTGCQWVVVDPALGDYKIDELCEIIHTIIKERTSKAAEDLKEKEKQEAEALKEKEKQEAEALKEKENKEAEAIKELEKIESLSVETKEDTVVKAKTIERQSAPVKKINNSAAKKERKKLLVGGGILLAVLCLLVVGILSAVLLIKKINTGDTDKPDQSGFAGIFDNANEDDFEYEIVNGNVTITEYIGVDTDVVIPDEIDGYTVKALSEKLFYCDSDITSVVLPDGITEIPKFAFYKCTSLSSVSIPDSVVIIGEHSFEGCTSLSKVVLSDNVNIIDDFAFNNCTGMTKLTLGTGITAIGNYAFATCTELTEIQLPDSLNSIGSMAFAYCENITEITIPENILTISDSAFSGCFAITVYYKNNTYSYDISGLVSELNGN